MAAAASHGRIASAQIVSCASISTGGASESGNWSEGLDSELEEPPQGGSASKESLRNRRMRGVRSRV